MIRIHRDANPPDIPVYTRTSSKALDGVTRITRYARELERATAHYTDALKLTNEGVFTGSSFGFVVYKDGALRDRLASVFRTKCAYCESDFGAVSPRDIEHFRPKGQITIAGGHKLKPAYFWVAGDWSNLLVSCPDCNRPRNHVVPGQSAEVLRGKGDQFPLSNEGRRIRDHMADLADEDPVRLLINPCEENPFDHLLFTADGYVTPRPDANGVPSEKGKISIDVYALQRSLLVQQRKAALLELDQLFVELERHLRILNKLSKLGSDPELQQDADENVRDCLKKLGAMFDLEAEYLAAKRDWMLAADEEGRFTSLRVANINPLGVMKDLPN